MTSVAFFFIGQEFVTVLTEFKTSIAAAATTCNSHSRSYVDIYSGQCYRSLYESGFFSQEGAISFTMNTDGIPMFKSNTMSLWPVYGMINELPYKLRYVYIHAVICIYYACQGSSIFGIHALHSCIRVYVPKINQLLFCCLFLGLAGLRSKTLSYWESGLVKTSQICPCS